MKALTSKASPALVVAALALLVALADTSWATLSQVLPRNSVGPAQIKPNAVTTTKIKDGTITLRDIARSSRRVGPQGPRGASGPVGPVGPPGGVTRLWAVVNSSGSISRSVNTTSAGRVGTGQYEIFFNQDVSNCVYQATVGEPGNISNAAGAMGFATVGRRSGNVGGVRVNTRSTTGAAGDRNFHLIVIC